MHRILVHIQRGMVDQCAVAVVAAETAVNDTGSDSNLRHFDSNAKLMAHPTHPKFLSILWREYMFGIGTNKVHVCSYYLTHRNDTGSRMCECV